MQLLKTCSKPVQNSRKLKSLHLKVTVIYQENISVDSLFRIFIYNLTNSIKFDQKRIDYQQDHLGHRSRNKYHGLWCYSGEREQSKYRGAGSGENIRI